MIFKFENITLPLFAFFKELQQYDDDLNHNALGYDVYMQLIDALASGYGLLDRVELYVLCKLILLKPYHDETVFEKIFDEHVSIHLDAEQDKSEEGTETDSPVDEKNAPETPTPIESEEEQSKVPETIEAEEINPEKNKKQKTVSLKFRPATTTQAQMVDADLDTIEKEIFSKNFLLKGKYPSVHPRRVEQDFRSMFVAEKAYNKQYFDVEGTVERVAKQGYLDSLVYKYKSENSLPINLLIDEGGSMVAFFYLVDMLKEKVRKMNRSETPIYYFRNTPVSKLYTNPEQTKSVDLTKFLKENKNPILIVSDAGAAKRRFEEERIEATRKFLSRLKHLPVAWINPVPQRRWAETSADYIDELVPMYEATNRAFARAIKRLK